MFTLALTCQRQRPPLRLSAPHPCWAAYTDWRLMTSSLRGSVALFLKWCSTVRNAALAFDCRCSCWKMIPVICDVCRFTRFQRVRTTSCATSGLCNNGGGTLLVAKLHHVGAVLFGIHSLAVASSACVPAVSTRALPLLPKLCLSGWLLRLLCA